MSHQNCTWTEQRALVERALDRVTVVLPAAVAAVVSQQLRIALDSGMVIDSDVAVAEEILAASLFLMVTAGDPGTMTVTVRDHAAEAATWGSGPTAPVTRNVTISAFCLHCGARRGEPVGDYRCDDGAYYWVQTWTNPCGHQDSASAVLTEALVLTQVQRAVRTRGVSA